MLVQNGSSGDRHWLRGGCAADPDPAAWTCTLEAYTSDADGDSPWHYALHARVRIADRSVDLGSFACPGA